MKPQRALRTWAEPLKKRQPSEYSSFEQLDGSHPWQKKMPENCVMYSVRRLEGGRVVWFNFALAKEMGLIDEKHPHSLNKRLEEKLLDTFCIRIINEFDLEKKNQYPLHSIKPHRYMATRYLQLQHDDKTGKTSGDGRCVWNGFVSNKGVTWDVSSRGTGVTALAPGVVAAGKPLESGNTDFGYGCGLAENDELYSSALMSEIMHHNSVPTERMLAIIDIGNGCGIGVRAAKNLFRPAHLFMYLKQNNYDSLKRATDFFIDRQHANGDWSFSVRYKSRYRLMLGEICERFAQFAAQLEREYIFAWLDWDGDNVLATAGIIDYGSVRQFGLRHDQYRYDDETRFSTNLNEQKNKAKLTVQVFAQLVDYLQTGEKKPLHQYKNDPVLEKFDRYYDYYLKDHFLFQLGLKKQEREFLLKNKETAVGKLLSTFTSLEKVKTHKKTAKVADGINRPAILNMRNFLREYPRLLLKSMRENSKIDEQKLFHLMISRGASRKDAKLRTAMRLRIRLLQRQYLNLIQQLPDGSTETHLRNILVRSKVINRPNRITGNALINIVFELLKSREKGESDHQIQTIMDHFIQSQIMRPEAVDPDEFKKLHQSLSQQKLGRTLLTLVRGHQEDI